MKTKKILIVLTCIMSVLLLTGCGKKEVITTKNFNRIAEDNSLIITDAKDQFADVDYLEEASIASSTAGWQIEFFTFTDEENAKNMYSKNKETFEEAKDSSSASSYSEQNMENYSSYATTANGNYMYICRVENTVLYLNVPKSNKDDVKKIVKELGY